MKIDRLISVMIPAGLGVFVMAVSAAAQETHSVGAAIKGFSKEKENGQTCYEAEMVVNGYGKDMLMDPSGAVVEVEQQVASLPAEVQCGLRAKAGKGKIVKVESLTKHGKLVAYEAVVRTNGEKSEIQLGSDGKPLSHEE